MTRRAVLAGGAMASTAAIATVLTPRRSERRLMDANLADVIPRTIGPWSVTTLAGMVVATEDEATAAEGYDQLLTRVYEAAGLPSIMLLLAYGSTQGGSLQLHRPETCYPGQGFALSNFSELDFNFGARAPVHARRFTAVRDQRIERLAYWTRISNRFPLTTAQEYASIIESVLRGFIPDGLLVRISSIGANTAPLDRAIERFAYSLVSATARDGRRLLIGDR